MFVLIYFQDCFLPRSPVCGLHRGMRIGRDWLNYSTSITKNLTSAVVTTPRQKHEIENRAGTVTKKSEKKFHRHIDKFWEGKICHYGEPTSPNSFHSQQITCTSGSEKTPCIVCVTREMHR